MFDSEFSLSVLLFILFNKVSTRRKKKPAAVSSFSTIIEREKQLIDLIFYSKKTLCFPKIRPRLSHPWSSSPYARSPSFFCRFLTRLGYVFARTLDCLVTYCCVCGPRVVGNVRVCVCCAARQRG